MSAHTTSTVTSISNRFGIQYHEGRYWSVDKSVRSFEGDKVGRMLDFDTVEQAIAHAEACARHEGDPVVENVQPAVTLRNGAKVLKALVVPGPGTDAERLEVGYVVADTGHDIVVWHVYRWLVGERRLNAFDAESGRYLYYGTEAERAEALAEATEIFEDKIRRYVRR